MSLLLTMGLGQGKEAVLPLVVNVTPAPGTAIATSQSLQMDVTDETGLALVLLTASFPTSAAVELVFDGTDFTALYSQGSSLSLIEGGFRFVLLRNGGWIGAPTLTPYVLDTSGNADA